jgi:periplasmic protein TonB
MFTQLVESKPAGKRSSTGTALSFVAHYGLILIVLYTSAEAADVADRPRDEKLVFVNPKKAELPEQRRAEPELVVAPPIVKPVLPLMAPLEIPDSLPEIDLTRPTTDPELYSGRRSFAEPSGTGTSTETVRRPEDPYFEFEVEKPVVQAPNSASPAYPDMLRQAGVEGDALVSFVVDTLGRVDVSTFKVIRATHELFATAVKNALPRMRFIPAETSRGRVRQLVHQPFSFAIVK